MKLATLLPFFLLAVANAQHNWGLEIATIDPPTGEDADAQRFNITLNATDLGSTNINIDLATQNATEYIYQAECILGTGTEDGLTPSNAVTKRDTNLLDTYVQLDYALLGNNADVWEGNTTDTTGTLKFCYVMEIYNGNYVMNYIKIDFEATFDLTKAIPAVNSISITDRSNEQKKGLEVDLEFEVEADVCVDNGGTFNTDENAGPATYNPGDAVTICVEKGGSVPAGVYLDQMWNVTMANNNTGNTVDFLAIDNGIPTEPTFVTDGCQQDKDTAGTGNHGLCWMTSTIFGQFFADLNGGTGVYEMTITGTVLFKLGTVRRMQEVNLRGLQAEADVTATGDFEVGGIQITNPGEEEGGANPVDDSSAAEKGILLLATAALSAFALI